MGPQRFSIVFDNPSAVYFPGQLVTGKVEFWIGENTKIKGELLKLQRQFRVLKGGHPVTGGESFLLMPGNYEYPFSFRLPPGLPSSFEGEFGHIRYTIKAIVNRPGKFNYEAKTAIAVNAIVDLNSSSLASESAQATDTTTICCWCCASGPISAQIWIEKMGYVPGQMIPFCAQVENLSGRMMLASKVQLIQTTTFRAQGMSKVVERVVTEENRGPFGLSATWDRVPIRVPPVPPSNLPSCSIIKVDYRLEFHVDPGTCMFSLKVPVSIVIGNVPLRSSFPMFQTPALPLNLSADVSEEATAGQYADLPPPTYEEATYKGNIREEEDCEHVNHGGTLEYAPRYLTYQMNA